MARLRKAFNEKRLPTDGSLVMSRRVLLQYGGALGAVTASPWLFSACSPAGDPDSAQGMLRIREVTDVGNLDPAFLINVIDGAVLACVAENLVTFSGDTAEVVPELADEFTSSEDGLRHEFRLKEGIQFHGGYGEVTAEDVKFSFERIAGLTRPRINAKTAAYWAALDEVRVTGKYTGVIMLKEPYAPLFLNTLPRQNGTIISKAAYEDMGKDFATHPIGTGPYEFVQWKRGQEVLLRRFDEWGGASLGWASQRPKWKEISFRPIVEDSAARIALETGEVDFTGIALADVDSFSDDKRFDVTKQAFFGMGWVGFNVSDEKLSDVRVRQAIRQALDVDSMITAAFDGKAARSYAPIPEGGSPIGYWADAPKYQRDVEKAKGLLAEAGVEGLELEMAYADEETSSRTIADIVQANLKDIGIEVSLRAKSGGSLYEDLGSLQMFYDAWSGGDDPSTLLDWFVTDEIGANNMMSWSNEEYDRLDRAASTELDPERRSEMYVRMQQLMDQDAVGAWVNAPVFYYAHKPGLIPSLNSGIYGKYRAWDFTLEGE